MPDTNPGLMTIVGEALELTHPDERAAYLNRACGTDAALRQRVEALLAAHAGAGRFLEPGSTATFDGPAGSGEATAAFGDGPTGPGRFSTFTSGAVIAGRYTLLDLIGEGGMGSVYRASQTEPVKRHVALKLIKAGMDSKAVLARFDSERQALAMMDHPNIARVYDGGTTTEGLPYFVMELVNGIPVTEYCDRRRLSVRARLELFVSVCHAVQHAHQKGIIHRDLKPANVLVVEVDGRPMPKVIDFGVAKATETKLTDMSLADTGAIVGTPAYMSPEQADPSAMDIDTRTDVYALGIVLYELLVGSPPIESKQFKRGAVLELLRMVREDDPPRPSTKLSTAEAGPNIAANRDTEPAKLAKLLQGELDWVVMKAIEKDRTRRYETANGLARDLQRYLADEVVEARPPSAGYRMRKFVRRHKGQVIAASLVAVTLLGGIVGTTLGLLEARKQEGKARGEATDKEKARAAEAERVTERDRANDELTHRLGVSAMVLANAAFDGNDYLLTAERLGTVPVGQRGWEWHYRKRQLRGGIYTLYGHTGPVTCVAFSPDGKRIVTGGGAPGGPFEAKVWDARTGVVLFELKGLPGRVEGVNDIAVVTVAFSPDGRRIVTAGGDKTVRVWDAATGTPQLEFKEQVGEESVNCATFNPDGTQLATAFRVGDVGLVKLWDARTGKPLLEWKAHTTIVTHLAFTPDGTRIVTAGYDLAVKVWDARTGTLRVDAKGMMGPESSFAVSPDGKWIVTGREDGTAKVIDAGTGGVRLELKGRPLVANRLSLTTSGVLCVAYSPDGTRFLTGGTIGGFGTGEVTVWDARTGAESLELKGHTGMVVSASFSPDGTRIVTGSADGTAKVWDARTGTPRLELEGIRGRIECAAFDPADARIVTGGNDGATVWDARTGIPQFTLSGLNGTVYCAAFSPDGTRIVTGSGRRDLPGGNDERGVATVWDARTGKALVEVKGLKGGVRSVSFDADGTRFVTGEGTGIGPRGGVKVWDARTGSVILDLSESGPERAFRGGAKGDLVSFRRDGKRIVIGGYRNDQTTGERAKVVDSVTGATLVEFMGHTGAVTCAAFSPDGERVVTGSYDKTVKVWDAERGGPSLVDMKGHTGEINCVAVSPDGNRIVSGAGDRTVRVWDVRTGTTLAEFKGFRGAVTSVSFSNDGTRILAAGGGRVNEPGQVFVWDAPNTAPEVELVGHAAWITSAAFSPDGTRIVSGSADMSVKVWDTRTGAIRLDLKGHTAEVQRVAFGPDGTRIVSSDGTAAKIWDANTGSPLLELKKSEGAIRGVAFSPDGTRVVTCGFKANTEGQMGDVTLWDTTSGAVLVEFPAIPSGMDRVAFGPDGTRVITVDIEGKVQTWDARTGKEVPDEVIPPIDNKEHFSRDGRHFARLNHDRVDIIPLVPDERELAYRRLHMEPDVRRYRAGYLAAKTVHDDFAAAFYFNLIPPDRRNEVIARAEADALAALTNLANDHLKGGKWEEAIPLLIEIRKINTTKVGPEGSATVDAAWKLGRAYLESGQVENAIPLLQDVLRIRKQKPGPFQQQTFVTLGMLGRAYKESGRLPEAIAVLEEASATAPWTTADLLDVYELAGEHAKIISVCLRLLAEAQKPLAEDELRARLGRAYLAQRKWSEAEPHLRECLALREKNRADHWATFEAQSLLGGSLLGQKRYAEAEPLLLKGYEGLKQREKSLEPRDAARLLEALDRLTELYAATNRNEMKKWQAERAKYPMPNEIAPPPRKK